MAEPTLTSVKSTEPVRNRCPYLKDGSIAVPEVCPTPLNLCREKPPLPGGSNAEQQTVKEMWSPLPGGSNAEQQTVKEMWFYGESTSPEVWDLSHLTHV